MQRPALEPLEPLRPDSADESTPEPVVASRARSKYLGALANIAKIALAIALLAWLARSGRLQVDAFSRLDARGAAWLVAAAGLQSAMIASMAVRWRTWLQIVPLASGERARLNWREVAIITARGACAGAWTPAGLGLDGVRAVHALRRFSAEPKGTEDTQDVPQDDAQDVSRGRTIGSVVTLASLLDRGVALVLLVALALPFVLALSREHSQRPQVLGAAVGGLVLLLIGAWAWWTRRRTSRGSGGARMGAGFDWRAAGSAGAWALGTHVANVLALGAAIVALSPDLDLARALRVTFEVAPAIILSGAIPLTPLGLGVADATGEALLARHGLSCGGEAVMLVRALWLVVCLACGVAFWLPERNGEEAKR